MGRSRADRLAKIDIHVMAVPLVLWSLAGVEALMAQNSVPLPRLSDPIEFDGVIDEQAWTSIEPLPMTMYQPTYGGTLTEPTEVRVAYDDNYIYVGARLYDSDPSAIRANTLYRERYSGDDTFGFVLDTFNDNENALWFFTTPEGVRFDVAVANDGEGRRMNFDFNTYWDVRTSRNGEGWFVEMRIPFTSMGFQDKGGQVEMGFITYRYIARKAERHIYPPIPPNWERGFSKPSMAQDVVLEDVYSHKPVYLTPYVLGGVEQLAELRGSGAEYGLESDRTGEIGADLKYKPTSNLTLDATVNTDFAQVEADDEQINLTRFSLFFPEKRQFFQERAGIFEFGFPGDSRLFHSRRIGLDDDGQPSRIIGGARLIGRAGAWDVGFLDMQTARSDSLPTENFGVVRVRRQVFDSVSNVGGMLTSRFGGDGAYNFAVGLDGIIRLFGDEYLTLKWAQSFEKGVGFADLTRARALLAWERRHDRGLSYETTASWSGPEFNPDIGFLRRTDFTFLESELSYQWLLGERGPLRRVEVGHEVSTYLRNDDTSAESAEIETSIELETKTEASARLELEHNYEDVREPFELEEGVEVPIGSYWLHEGSLRYEAATGSLFRPEVRLSAGSFYDGWRVSFSADPTWNLSRHLELQANYELNVIRFPDRDQRLDSHLARLRLQAALDTHASASAFVQYNSVADVIGINVRLRYHFREGVDLWLVYDEGVNTERSNPFGPTLPMTNNRSLLLKFTHTSIL